MGCAPAARARGSPLPRRAITFGVILSQPHAVAHQGAQRGQRPRHRSGRAGLDQQVPVRRRLHGAGDDRGSPQAFAVSWHSSGLRAPPPTRCTVINQAGSEDIGRGLVKDMAEQLNHKGDIAILSATQNATNQNTWIKIMKDELSKPRYRDMKLVKTAYGDDVDQKSFQETQGLLKAYPDLKGIISPTTVGLAAAARYVSGSKYKGKVTLGGLGTPNQMRKYIKNGTLEQFSLWDASKLGYLGAYAAALSSGQITGKEGEKFTAGKLGEYTVGQDGEVVLGPPTVFDSGNIDDFDF